MTNSLTSIDKTSSNDHEKDPEVLTTIVSAIEETARKEGVRPIFLAKVKVLNNAITEVGMGKYQWLLFLSAGFG